MQIAVSPLAARALFGMPAGELASIDLDAGDVLGRTAGELHERMRSAPGWAARFAIADLLLGARADHDPAAPPEITLVWRLILRSRGSIPVGALAGSVGWSERHLRNRFRAETGLTPKAAIRVARLTGPVGCSSAGQARASRRAWRRSPPSAATSTRRTSPGSSATRAARTTGRSSPARQPPTR
jgi:AraC-like DNA-binding protein